MDLPFPLPSLGNPCGHKISCWSPTPSSNSVHRLSGSRCRSDEKGNDRLRRFGLTDDWDHSYGVGDPPKGRQRGTGEGSGPHDSRRSDRRPRTRNKGTTVVPNLSEKEGVEDCNQFRVVRWRRFLEVRETRQTKDRRVTLTFSSGLLTGHGEENPTRRPWVRTSSKE